MEKKLLGKRINAARKERGWTSERLAEVCNINATYLRQIESGAKTPSLQVFVSLCDALRCNRHPASPALTMPETADTAAARSARAACQT